MRKHYHQELVRITGSDELSVFERDESTQGMKLVLDSSYVALSLIELGPPQDREEFDAMLRYMRQCGVLEDGAMDELVERVVGLAHKEWIQALLTHMPENTLLVISDTDEMFELSCVVQDMEVQDCVRAVAGAAKALPKAKEVQGYKLLNFIGELLENEEIEEELMDTIDQYRDILGQAMDEHGQDLVGVRKSTLTRVLLTQQSLKSPRNQNKDKVQHKPKI